jgi:hypothetical protein
VAPVVRAEKDKVVVPAAQADQAAKDEVVVPAGREAPVVLRPATDSAPHGSVHRANRKAKRVPLLACPPCHEHGWASQPRHPAVLTVAIEKR